MVTDFNKTPEEGCMVYQLKLYEYHNRHEFNLLVQQKEKQHSQGKKRRINRDAWYNCCHHKE